MWQTSRRPSRSCCDRTLPRSEPQLVAGWRNPLGCSGSGRQRPFWKSKRFIVCVGWISTANLHVITKTHSYTWDLNKKSTNLDKICKAKMVVYLDLTFLSNSRHFCNCCFDPTANLLFKLILTLLKTTTLLAFTHHVIALKYNF